MVVAACPEPVKWVGPIVAVGVLGPVVATIARVGVGKAGLGVTVTARGVAPLPGQQPATAAVACACVCVSTGVQLASSGTARKHITMNTRNRTTRLDT